MKGIDSRVAAAWMRVTVGDRGWLQPSLVTVHMVEVARLLHPKNDSLQTHPVDEFSTRLRTFQQLA